MIVPNKKKVYEKCLSYWGADAQTDMMIEEASELIKAILKYRRNDTERNLAKIYEEIADTEIMLEQMKIIFNENSRHLFWKKEKLERLKNLIDEYVSQFPTKI